MRPGDTPVPIPNTMVKTWTADGTMLGTAWESRWLPGSLIKIRGRRCEAEGRMYIENCTQKVIEEITTSDSYYKRGKESKDNCFFESYRHDSPKSKSESRKAEKMKKKAMGKGPWGGLPPTLGRAGSSRTERYGRGKVKQRRAQGGCLGTGSRRKT